MNNNKRKNTYTESNDENNKRRKYEIYYKTHTNKTYSDTEPDKKIFNKKSNDHLNYKYQSNSQLKSKHYQNYYEHSQSDTDYDSESESNSDTDYNEKNMIVNYKSNKCENYDDDVTELQNNEFIFNHSEITVFIKSKLVYKQAYECVKCKENGNDYSYISSNNCELINIHKHFYEPRDDINDLQAVCKDCHVIINKNITLNKKWNGTINNYLSKQIFEFNEFVDKYEKIIMHNFLNNLTLIQLNHLECALTKPIRYLQTTKSNIINTIMKEFDLSFVRYVLNEITPHKYIIHHTKNYQGLVKCVVECEILHFKYKPQLGYNQLECNKCNQKHIVSIIENTFCENNDHTTIII